MAALIDFNHHAFDAATSVVPDMPDTYAVDDILAMVFYKKEEDATEMTPPSGWSERIPDSGSRITGLGQVQIFYKEVTSIPVASPTLAATVSSRWNVLTMTIRGGDSTDILPYCDIKLGGSTFPTPTLTQTNTLLVPIICTVGSNGKRKALTWETHGLYVPELTFAKDPSGFNQQLTAFHTVQAATGITDTYTNVVSGFDNHFLMLGFSNTVAKTYHTYTPSNAVTPICKFIENEQIDTQVDAGATVEDPTTDIPSIDGNTTYYPSSPAYGVTGVRDMFTMSELSTETVSELNLYRHNYNGAVLDFSTGAFAYHVKGSQGTNLDLSLLTGGLGLVVVLEDSLGNWSAYNFPKGEFYDRQYNNCFFIQFEPSVKTPIESTGTLPNLSDITKISYGNHKSATASYQNTWQFARIITGDYVVAGGGEAVPVNAGRLAFSMEGLTENSYFKQGESQLFLTRGLQLGDTSHDIYADFAFNSIEFVDNDEVATTLSAGFVGIRLNPNANSTINFSKSTITGVNQWDFECLSGATAAKVNLDNAFILNANDIILNDAISSATNALFANFNSFTLGTADLSSGATIEASNNSSGIVVTSEAELGNLGNCTLIDHTTPASAVKIAGDQTGTWADPDLIVSGNTKDIEYTGATDFSISASVGKYTILNSGAGVLTLSSVTSITVSNANLVDTSRVQLYNVTAVTELENVVLSGAGYTSATLVAGTDYTIGDTLRIRATQAGAATAKLEYEEFFVGGSTNVTLVGVQEADATYASYGVNGSTVPGVSADYVNDEVDITVASNFTIASIYAWWVYNLTTSQGISDFYGGISVVDSANILINNSVVDIKMDNTTTTDVWATDTIRLYRADSARPVRQPTSGLGGIDIQWREKVYTTTTGSGPLTASQEAELTNAANAAAIKATTDKLIFTKANELDVNLQSLNGTALNGTGAEGDLWRG